MLSPRLREKEGPTFRCASACLFRATAWRATCATTTKAARNWSYLRALSTPKGQAPGVWRTALSRKAVRHPLKPARETGGSGRSARTLGAAFSRIWVRQRRGERRSRPRHRPLARSPITHANWPNRSDGERRPFRSQRARRPPPAHSVRGERDRESATGSSAEPSGSPWTVANDSDDLGPPAYPRASTAHLCRDDAVVPDAQIRRPGSAVRRPRRCRGPSGARREATADPTSPETSPTRESSAGRENPAGGAATKGVPARRDGRPAGKSSSRTGRFASINLIPGEIVHPRPRKRHTRSGRSRQAPRLRNPPAALEAGRLASQIQPRTAAFRVAIGRPGDVSGPPIAELRRPPHALANGARHHEINAQPRRARLANGTGDVDDMNLERNNRVDGTNHVLLPSNDPFEHMAQR
ncbi:hypothetical protein ISCGN_001346 [Ixodes scapularis]